MYSIQFTHHGVLLSDCHVRPRQGRFMGVIITRGNTPGLYGPSIRALKGRNKPSIVRAIIFNGNPGSSAIRGIDSESECDELHGPVAGRRYGPLTLKILRLPLYIEGNAGRLSPPFIFPSSHPERQYGMNTSEIPTPGMWQDYCFKLIRSLRFPEYQWTKCAGARQGDR